MGLFDWLFKKRKRASVASSRGAFQASPDALLYEDGEDTRSWTILEGLNRIEAIERYPDFDTAYLRAAYPTGNADDHKNANVNLLLEGLGKSRVKSHILRRLSNYYVWGGEEEKALYYAVQSFLAAKLPPRGAGTHQPLIFLQYLFSATGYPKEADKLSRLNSEGYMLGHKEASDVAKVINVLAESHYNHLVKEARNSLEVVWKRPGWNR